MNITPEVHIALIGAILIFVLILIFRNRVAEVVFGPAKLTLFKPEQDQAARANAEEEAHKAAKIASQGSVPHWHKVASLFWLGNDLMWITDMMYRAAPPERVLQGVNIARQYLRDLGFPENSFPLQQLTLATDILESIRGATQKRFLESHYRTVAQEIQSIKWYLSALAEQQEPGFQKGRALPQEEPS
jgi:hypothetical protein